jgi:hypothetical protein
MVNGRNRIRGGALIAALAFTALAAFLIAGVSVYSVGSLNRVQVEADYASAVSIADAGINAIVKKISQDPTDTTLVNQADNPLQGSVPGVGTFSAWVVDETTGGNWAAPADMLIYSVGNVNGITRKVRVKGARKSVFDEYAIFMDEGGTLGGSGASGGSTQIVGNVGSNGSLTFNGTLGSDAINGELTLHGGAGTNSDDGNVVNDPDRVQLPTVAETALLLFPQGGLTWLRTNNANASMMVLKPTDTALTGITTINGLTAAQATHGIGGLFNSAGLTNTTYNWQDPTNSVSASSSTLDQVSAGANRRFATATAGDEIFNRRTYFLPPGDYYFENVDFNSGNSAIVLLTHLGRIRIWVDDPQNRASIGGNGDRLQCVVIFTDQSPSKFRLFYNKCTTMNINGSSTFRGGFYAVKPECTSGPTMDFSGNTMVYGSVISSYINLGGGTQIIFPNDGGGADPTDYSLWFGIKNGWLELPINDGGPTFVTGTNN